MKGQLNDINKLLRIIYSADTVPEMQQVVWHVLEFQYSGCWLWALFGTETLYLVFSSMLKFVVVCSVTLISHSEYDVVVRNSEIVLSNIFKLDSLFYSVSSVLSSVHLSRNVMFIQA